MSKVETEEEMERLTDAIWKHTKQIFNKLQWYRNTTCNEDAEELRKIGNDLWYKPPRTQSDAVAFLRDVFDKTDSAYIMCVVSNIAENLYGIHFPRIEQKHSFRPKLFTEQFFESAC